RAARHLCLQAREGRQLLLPDAMPVHARKRADLAGRRLLQGRLAVEAEFRHRRLQRQGAAAGQRARLSRGAQRVADRALALRHRQPEMTRALFSAAKVASSEPMKRRRSQMMPTIAITSAPITSVMAARRLGGKPIRNATTQVAPIDSPDRIIRPLFL